MAPEEKQSIRAPLAFVVLALLMEEPMHAYRIQQLIHRRGKDKIVNVSQRNSVQQILGRLLRGNVIEILETVRDAGYPPRTVYRITDEGRALAKDWLDRMLSDPAREYPQFPAALSFLGLTTVGNALDRLSERRDTLAGEVRDLEQGLKDAPGLPRVFLIEDEYMLAVRRAELDWIESTLDDLRTGSLGWDTDELLRLKAQYEPG